MNLSGFCMRCLTRRWWVINSLCLVRLTDSSDRSWMGDMIEEIMKENSWWYILIQHITHSLQINPQWCQVHNKYLIYSHSPITLTKDLASYPSLCGDKWSSRTNKYSYGINLFFNLKLTTTRSYHTSTSTTLTSPWLTTPTSPRNLYHQITHPLVLLFGVVV